MSKGFFILLLLTLFSFKSSSADGEYVKEINKKEVLTGCLLLYGGEFYFYPNIKIKDFKNIFSKKKFFAGFVLSDICSDFIQKDNYDVFFSTMNTDNKNPKLDKWNRIHYSEVELYFELCNIKLKDKVYPAYNQYIIIDGEVITLNVLGTIFNSSIHTSIILEENGNPIFKEDTERFNPRVLRFDCSNSE